MRRDVTLSRVQDVIKDYKEDESTSKYYKELKKSFEEYASMQIHTKKIDRLYLKHMNDLCNYLEEKRNYRLNIAITILMIIFTIGCVIYASYGFMNIDKNVVPRIMTTKPDVSLNVTYEDINNLMLQTYPASGNIEDLRYATININPVGDNREISYNIYIVPMDYEKIKANLDLYKFDIDGKTITLSDITMVNGKLKIYSGKMNTNEVKKLKMRLWIDEDINHVFESFSFKIDADGHVM